MKIAALDDDALFLENLSGLFERSERGRGVHLVSFTNPNAFFLADLESFDAFFLDIYLGQTNGLSVAEILKKRIKNPLIVFLTTSREKGAEAFALEAIHYLVKPIDLSALDEALSRLEERLDGREKKIVLESKDGLVSLPLSDIFYIESFGNCKDFMTKNGSLSIRKSTAEVLSLLSNDPRFYTLSRSYIVNFDYVKGLKKEGLLLTTGAVLPLPRNRRKEVTVAFLSYIQG
jgi:DNA-binding LytR/AlgR family response regulator